MGNSEAFFETDILKKLEDKKSKEMWGFIVNFSGNEYSYLLNEREMILRFGFVIFQNGQTGNFDSPTRYVVQRETGFYLLYKRSKLMYSLERFSIHCHTTDLRNQTPGVGGTCHTKQKPQSTRHARNVEKLSKNTVHPRSGIWRMFAARAISNPVST